MANKVHRRPAIKTETFHGIITTSDQMRHVFELLRRIARTDGTVLIRGETGTGKELVARAVHNLSRRRKQPFMAINCATLTPELAASELFGHRKGAFTGAVRDRRGLFAAGNRGTVFLDEVAELSLDIQARLLRVLQERTIVPVGSTDPVKVDVRLLSATHRSLRGEVEARRFREDLMFRVRVVPIFLPPLRERPGDVTALLWHFIDSFNERDYRRVTAIDDRAYEAILAYHWPGNVRELHNAVEYAMTIGEGTTITLDELPPELRGEHPPRSDAVVSLREEERQRVLQALRQAQGKKGKAAEILGVNRTTLWRKLREFNIT